MQHLLKPNIALFVGRQGLALGNEEWTLIFCGDKIEDYNLFRRGNNACFPLFIYNAIKAENYTTSFRNFIDKLYQHQYSSEQLLGYIYSILHSPTYRTKYAEFLKRDFPRIPFPVDKKIFEELSELGQQLIQAHLLKHPDLQDDHKVDLKGKGDEIVEKPAWNGGKLFINKSQWFEPVTKEVYEFYIGGYQVLDKYLKDRKGRKLDSNDVFHLCYVIQSLQFTLEQMKIIDAKTSSWI